MVIKNDADDGIFIYVNEHEKKRAHSIVILYACFCIFFFVSWWIWLTHSYIPSNYTAQVFPKKLDYLFFKLFGKDCKKNLFFSL